MQIEQKDNWKSHSSVHSVVFRIIENHQSELKQIWKVYFQRRLKNIELGYTFQLFASLTNYPPVTSKLGAIELMEWTCLGKIIAMVWTESAIGKRLCNMFYQCVGKFFIRTAIPVLKHELRYFGIFSIILLTHFSLSFLNILITNIIRVRLSHVNNSENVWKSN